MSRCIKIENMSFQYPAYEKNSYKKIFENFSAVFNPGEAVALLGPNGAGKSTLLNLMAGSLAPSRGGVYIDGREAFKINPSELSRIISVVPQQHNPSFNFTAREIIAMGRAPYNGFFGIAAENDFKAIEEISKKVEVETFLDKDYTRLSGGERKRVILARAMAQNTPIMLFDEPEAHLDIRHQHHFLKLIYDSVISENKLCIYSVHNPSLALRYSTRVMLIGVFGEIIASGPTLETMNRENLEKAYGIKFAYTSVPRLCSEADIKADALPLLYVDI